MFSKFNQVQQIHGSGFGCAPLIITTEIHGEGNVIAQGQHRKEVKGLINHTHIGPSPLRKLILLQLMNSSAIDKYLT